MRQVMLAVLFFSLTQLQYGQEKTAVKRFGVTADFELYPQSTPKELTTTLLKVLEKQKYDYLVAHLLDPVFIDERMRASNSKPEDIIKEIKDRFTKDPDMLRKLEKTLRSGEIADDGTKVSIKLKELKSTQVYFKRINNRWFMENRSEPEPPSGKD